MAFVNNCYPIADGLNHCHFMSNHNHGNSQLPVNLLEQLQDRLGCVGIQGAGCLITEKHLGIRGNRSCNRHSLLLTAGQLGWISSCPFLQTYQLQQLHGPVLCLCLSVRMVLCNFHGKTDIFQNGSLGQQIKLLKNHSHGLPCHSPLCLAHSRQIFPFKQHLSRCGNLQHIDTSYQCALSCSGKANNSKNLTSVNIQINVV